MAPQSQQLRPGAYAATLTFFKSDDESLDLETLKKHVLRLAKSRLAGIITLGSNGEAPHLSIEERKLVTKTTREALDSSGFEDLPVIVGASGQSVRETIQLCHDAAEAGGSHVLVLPPSYFKAAMTDDAIYNFYMRVAEASPLPMILYSFPAVVAGIEMSSDLLIRISKGHSNIVGTKFTCGDTGKLARVARAMKAAKPGQQTPGYWAVGGLADFALQALVAGGSGVIAGGGNVTPKACVHVYKLFMEGKLSEAMEAQAILSEGDWIHTKGGIGATKSILQSAFGYGGSPRLPLTPLTSEAARDLGKEMESVISYEAALA
jgi:L-threo-3-deoxy-hexylosonate aldolase